MQEIRARGDCCAVQVYSTLNRMIEREAASQAGALNHQGTVSHIRWLPSKLHKHTQAYTLTRVQSRLS